MITKLYISDDGWVELPVYNRMEYDERLDEQLDSGSIQTINDSDVTYEDYSLYEVVTTDINGESKEEVMFGFDTVEKRGEGYYIHTIELVEPTRILMGIMIDGMNASQPITGTKKSLYDVTYRLLKYATTRHYDGTDVPLFYLDEDTAALLQTVESPEFSWQSETLLWECLCDLANVVNCIPRLIVNTSTGTMNMIKFDKINDITAEYEL